MSGESRRGTGASCPIASAAASPQLATKRKLQLVEPLNLIGKCFPAQDLTIPTKVKPESNRVPYYFCLKCFALG